MTIFAKIGSFLLIPFLAFSAWFGGIHQVSTSTPPPEVSPQTTVTLESILPSGDLDVGTVITLTGSGFTADNSILLDGMVAARDVSITSSTNGQQTISFTLPSSVGPDCKAGEACPMYMRLLTSGTYPLSVENENGISNAISVSVVATSSL